MTVLGIAAVTVFYLGLGFVLLRYFISRGALTVEHDAAYGLILLLWPLVFVVAFYLIFNAVVYVLLAR